VDHPLVLLCIITGLISGHPSVIGYDEMIQCGSHGKAHTIRVGGLDYRIQAELFKLTALCRQAMRCWSVESTDENKEGYVVKDC
jgi:hypothetical protein